MSDDLVERVARAIRDASELSTIRDFFQDCARAAIAVVLEEAAKCADRNAAEAWTDQNAPDTRGLMRLQAEDIAAAIRALVKEPQP